MTLASIEANDEPSLESGEDVEGNKSIEANDESSLESLKKDELLKIASEKGIDGITSKTTKDQIIEMIKKA